MSLRNSNNSGPTNWVPLLNLNLSDNQIYNEIDSTKKCLAEIEENSLVFGDNMQAEKKLSPWLNKKKNSKNYGISFTAGKPKKVLETENSEKSQ